MAETKAPQKIPATVWYLSLVSLFNDIASEMIYPIVPIFLTSVLGAPVTVVGLIEGVAEGTASITKTVFGYWSDRIHKRKVFVALGYGCGAISKLLTGLATVWPFVLFARFIDRFGKGLRTSARDAILLQNATKENKGFIFGFHRSIDSLGAVIGPLVALVFLDLMKENIRLTFLAAFVPAAIGVLLLLLFVKEKPQPPAERKKPIRISWKEINPSLKLFFLISIVFAAGNSSDAFLILRSKGLGLTTTMVVLAYVLYNVTQTLFATPGGRLADRIGARRVYAIGLAVFSLVYLAFGLINSAFWVWLLFPVYGIYIAFTDGVSKAYIADFITERESGTYFGIYQTGIAIAQVFASVIAGYLWNAVHPSAAFFYGGIMAAIALIILMYGKVSKQL